MSKWRIISSGLFLIIGLNGFAQLAPITVSDLNLELPKLKVTKTGAYIGCQFGSFTVPEFGGERQWQRVRLNNPITHAIHSGVNFNIKYKVFGYDLGYWYKPNRLGLTYGANLIYRTDFTHNRIGVAPVIGYKIWQIHAQAGYHFLTPRYDFETNTLFVTLRFVMINDRDWKIKKKKKD